MAEFDPETAYKPQEDPLYVLLAIILLKLISA